jgi:serine phosphatase RsbU (regulator of sigma subunit)
MNKIIRTLIIFLIFIESGFAQNLDSEVIDEIEKYKSEVEKYKENKNSIQQANFLNKIAYVFWENELFDEAINYFSKSLEINQLNKNKNGIKSLYFNIGLIYSDKEDYQLALSSFDNGLRIAQQLKQTQGIYTGLINKAGALKNLSQSVEAISVLKNALQYAQELNNLKHIRTCYGMLAENYEIENDSENTLKYFELFASVDKHIKLEQIKEIEKRSKKEVHTAQTDKIKTEQELSKKSDQLVETQQTLKETEEISKQQELELNLKELAIREKEAQLENEKLIRYGVSAIFVFILLFSMLIYRQYKAKKRVNEKLAEQNQKINIQKEEIEKQRDLANTQKTAITDSIRYAKRIQSALLPPESYIKRNLPDHFILYKPRDIVSGDFYWMMNKDDKIIITAADCTGHGVPGAFMSMLGIAFLNEILTKIIENKHVYSLQANEILNQLRTYIIESLHQTGDPDESKDGIDMAICIIDPENHKLQYAGAHNPLYLVQNNELKIIKGDRMPVGIHKKADVSFTNHEIDINENDLIYMFSDGYYDQIGGPKGRKFMSRNFQQLMLDIHKESLPEQKKILDKTFEEWKGKEIQLDDILVIGVKLELTKKTQQKDDSYDWSNKVILIAEDTEMNYIFLVEALRPTKVKILRAKDGEEAVSIFKETEKINLILMDINMPKLDGFETTKEIKKINPNVPIIAQTALNIEDAREKAAEVGCDDYILKPIRLKYLLTKLDTFLNN